MTQDSCTRAFVAACVKRPNSRSCVTSIKIKNSFFFNYRIPLYVLLYVQFLHQECAKELELSLTERLTIHSKREEVTDTRASIEGPT